MHDDLKQALRAQMRGEAPEDAWSTCGIALDVIEKQDAKLARVREELERVKRERDDARDNHAESERAYGGLRKIAVANKEAAERERATRAKAEAELREACEKYGLPTSLAVLLRHIENNHAATLGFKDMTIDTLSGKVEQAEARLEQLQGEEAVERAAKAIARSTGREWSQGGVAAQALWRDFARAALEAALLERGEG